MTFRYGLGWVVQAPEGDDTAAGAAGDDSMHGGEDTVVGGEGDDTVVGGAADDTLEGVGAGDKKVAEPKDMLAAIDEGLGYKAGEKGAAAVKPAEKKPAAADGKETDTAHANGKPKKNDKGEDLDAEGKVVAKQSAKLKTAAELDLKPEERKALGTKAQIRFGELINTVKAHEARVTRDAGTIKTLSDARDALLGVLEETKTTQDELVGYLEFNALLKSGDPKNYETALGIVEKQREALYKALGKEPAGGGIDLLADFPDLKKQVDEEEITRQAALEIAHGRREKTRRTELDRRATAERDSKQQSAEQRKKDGDAALKGIEEWTAGLSKSDLDYKAKEDKLLAKLDEVLKSYPPSQWLPTLKLLYQGIEIQKAPAGPGGHKPLRPSGARPGNKAPASMQEAIDQGLGYATAEKG